MRLYLLYLLACLVMFYPVAIDGKRKLKILINNPQMAYSHIQFLGRMADILVDAGHEVHMLMLVGDEKWSNFTGSTKAHKIFHVERPEHKKREMSDLPVMHDSLKGYSIGGIQPWIDFLRVQASFCEGKLKCYGKK
jgi:hypothetical protein